jgi:hypothetical protein
MSSSRFERRARAVETLQISKFDGGDDMQSFSFLFICLAFKARVGGRRRPKK